jgi:hypothetical protein
MQQRASRSSFFGLWLLAVLQAGCGSGSGGDPQGLGGSLFQSTKYQVRAVLVDKDQEPVPLESLSVYASPASVVRLHVKEAIEEYDKEVKSAQNRIRELHAQASTRRDKLLDTEREIQEEYESRRPKDSEDLASQARNPLKELSRIRAEKSKVDSWYKSQIAEKVEPAKAEIASLEKQSEEVARHLRVLRAGFNDRLFERLDTLPLSSRKHWKTTSNGFVTIDIPNDQPWTVWSIADHNKTIGVRRDRSRNFQTEHETNIVQKNRVRWLMEVPRDLDSNQSLHLDLTTAVDLNELAIDRRHSDGPVIRVQRP